MDYVPQVKHCYYSMNDETKCSDDYKLLNVIELKRNVPLSQLVKTLDSEKLKYYFRSFRMRFRLYKAIWKRVIQLKADGFKHCRLSIDNITLEFPEDFRDLENDIYLRDNLMGSPLPELDFENKIKVKFLEPDFITRRNNCPHYNLEDPYFSMMTTMNEDSQIRREAFGSWELAMLFLQFETEFHMMAGDFYSNIDPQLSEKFKLMIDVGDMKYIQREFNQRNPLENNYQRLQANLLDMRVKRVYKTSDLQEIINSILLKNYQMNQVMSGKEIDEKVFIAKEGIQYPYKKFMRFIRMNLVVNIKKRIKFSDNMRLLNSIHFTADQSKSKKHKNLLV